MDRDPGENALDAVERVSPPSGDNDTGHVGDAETRAYKRRQARETEAKASGKARAPQGDQSAGRKP
jgi:hypothetical protein